MCRIMTVLGLFWLVSADVCALAAEPRLGDALVLQEAFEQAIKKAEPAIACILVSRNDVYQRWFGETPSEDGCKLGDFDPTRAVLRVLPEAEQAQLEELKKAIARKATRGIQIEEELRRMYDLADAANVPESYGSGVVLDGDKGLILTNYHVIRDATKLYVRLPGGKGSYADIHAANQRSDLAVLRIINSNILPVPALKLGDGGKARKGQFVLSLANPYAAGFKDGSPSASWGIISNLRRRATVPERTEYRLARLPLHNFETLIQTDARLNLGCSGGALINLQGELIGLTTSLAAISGAEAAGGYAVPMNDAMRAVVDALLRGEEVTWGFLGITFGDAERRRRDETQEVLVTPIEGSPIQRALAASLRPHEAISILTFNGVSIRENADLFLAVSTLPAGAKARIRVRCAGEVRDIQVALDKLYLPDKVIASVKPKAFRGLRVDYTSLLYQRDFPSSGVPRGVFVREVEAGSAADNARLQDAVIIDVNGKEVTSPAEFYQAVERLTGPVTVTILSRGDLGTRKVKLD